MNARRLGHLLAALACAASASTAHAAAPPAPQPWSSSYAHPGGHLAVVVTVKRTTRVAITLSTDAKRSSDDLPLATKRIARGSAKLRVALPATTPVGVRTLLVCRSSAPHRCGRRATIHITAAPTATQELVDAAVAQHHLTAARAVVYRVWSIFGDTRVPAKYRGDIDADPDDGALTEAIAARHTMRARDRRAIAPFLVPPPARNSWLAHAGGARVPATATAAVATAARANSSKSDSSKKKDERSPRACDAQATSQHWRALTGTHVRVWWQQGHAANRRAAAALVDVADTKIWPAFSKLMGREPPSDVGGRCDGGDRHYDIYLLPKDIIDGTFRAVTLPFGPHCSGGASFTEVNTHNGVDPPTRFELAHELFHAFQFAFKQQGDCAAFREHRWFDEASAVWASTWLFPHEEGAHERVPVEWIPNSVCSINSFKYDAFPYVLDLQQRYGIETVPKIYAAFADTATSLQAIDRSLSGGLATTWRTFVRDAWNAEPTGAVLRQWYGITELPVSSTMTSWCMSEHPYELGLGGGHAYRHQVDLRFAASLTARYDDITLGAGVREVTVRNHTVGNRRSDVQVFLQHRDGTWATQDLTDVPLRRYCVADEHITRVVLAYGDHSIDQSTALDSPHSLPPQRGIYGTYDNGLMIETRDSCAQYFNVSAVTGSLTYSASYGAKRYPGDGCMISGAESSTAQLDVTQRTGGADGSYDRGTFSLNVPMRWTGTLDYSSNCPEGTAPACHLDIDEPGGPLATGIADAGAPTVAAQIIAPKPHLLNGCASSFGDAYWSGGAQLIEQAVPLAAITSGEPFAITWDEDLKAADRHTVAHLTATATPVAQDGTPRSTHPEINEGVLP